MKRIITNKYGGTENLILEETKSKKISTPSSLNFFKPSIPQIV